MLDKNQKRAYDIAMSGDNVYIAGVAGAGKTYVLKKIIADLRSESMNVVVSAFTMQAALNIDDDGKTIYKIFNTYPKGLDLEGEGMKRLKDSPAYSADVIIIDEISMVSKSLFEYICEAIRIISWKNNQEIQLIVVGDFLQLPPVCGKFDEVEYAFESELWEECNFKVALLEEQHRQSDSEFFEHLCQVRKGCNILENLSYLKNNANYCDENKEAITLCSYRKDVMRINMEKIKSLPGESKIYEALTNCNDMLNKLTVWKRMELKMGTLVMTVFNDNRGKFYNGATGYIINMTDDNVTVKFTDSTKDKTHIEVIGKRRWSMEEEGKIHFVEQLPIIPAYAITIHKAQGCTLECVNVNPKCFADGQLYVALSRVKNVKNLYITEPISVSDIKVNKRVIDFYNNIYKNNEKITDYSMGA